MRTFQALMLLIFFAIGDPAPPADPILSSVVPSQITAGSRDTGLNLAGSNFRSNARAVWNRTQPLATSFVSSTSLRALVPAANLATPGTSSIAVSQATGANQSTSKSFTITVVPAPLPVLTAISPAHVLVGAPAFTLTVTGTGFTSSAVVMWDTTALTTTFVSATSLTAAVPTTLYTTAGTSNIIVKNASGNSNALVMTKIGPLVITSTTFPNGTVGATYWVQLMATGGTPPYVWSITSGALPAGLTLNVNTGAILGTPTVAAASTFTATVTDSSGTIARRKFTFGKTVEGK